MRFDAKKKKPKKVKREPRLGDVKEVTSFAFFPTKIGDQYIWLERYIKVKRYMEIQYYRTYEVSSGLLEDALTTTGLLNTRTVTRLERMTTWSTIEKKLIHDT